MEEDCPFPVLEAEIIGIQFGLATPKDICTASISDCPISHSAQLTNPFLGLPLEFGKCESCGASETGKCEGHFGYIELPVPIYHPSYVSELKRMLSLLCLKCLKLKNNQSQMNNPGVAERMFACCEEAVQVSIREVKKAEGVSFLELKVPARARPNWSFLERYGFRYGDNHIRTLLPFEVMEILKKIPPDTRKKLSRKGYFPQDGYIVRYLPVPPNCLSVPDVSDGTTMLSLDLSTFMLKKVLKQVEVISSSRCGDPNFGSHEIEAVELQLAVDQYLQVRGTVKTARDADTRFGLKKEGGDSTTKAWLEKMRTLFIRKGSGFSSRSVITGDAYTDVNEIGIPEEVAKRITFEERVTEHNRAVLQKLVDCKLCLTYRDGPTTFSLREGSKGHTSLRLGQVVHRRIQEGDMVFINRPPTTHKHSLQALRVYIHDDHVVKINPLICGPLSADFDGDCIHLFYPQSVAAKAEVMELFALEKQLLSSHNGNLLLQLTTDSMLSLKSLHKKYFLQLAKAQNLSMFVSTSLHQPTFHKAQSTGSKVTALQIIQICLPSGFDCFGDKYSIKKSEVLELDLRKDAQPIMSELLASIYFEKGANAVLQFLNSLQPLLMEYLYSHGYSLGLNDFYIPKALLERTRKSLYMISPLLGNLRSKHNDLVEMQVDSHIRSAKVGIVDFVSGSSILGDLVDCRSESGSSKVVQQMGFLGLQVADKGKFYTKTLVEDIASHFECNHPHSLEYPSAKFGLIGNCFFNGLDAYEEMVHSISAREVIVRSSRGLSEPGTLFKNLMAILRDVIVCYDGTVRNVSGNSIIQFEYGVKFGKEPKSLFPAGEPVGVLAATAMSNPAYKAVLDSTSSSNSSWELMKEILLCKVNFKNGLSDRRVILYLNDCGCGRKYCLEKAAYMVKNYLEKVTLKDITELFLIEYQNQETLIEGGSFVGLCGHIHLNKDKLEQLNISMQIVLQKCEEKLASYAKKKKVGHIFRRTTVTVSESCPFDQPCSGETPGCPCLMFFFQDGGGNTLEKISDVLSDLIFPALSETTVKGDSRIALANITWVRPDTTTWIRKASRSQNVELVVDVVLEKSAVKQSGDSWRVVLDCCLPILHLIDTTRSVPYATKQVQELLGISCAFDQAVQRLSTSVTMVAKGVLKEHLILLASSMTCTGNLVGFNPGGYKALARSFNIEVPFTEATLFTPKKCFEMAAVKCHLDTLSSVVASCSWGKRVAVGTGSSFDILLDKNETSFVQDGHTDVYNFLSMVTSGTEEGVSACLGDDVDDLMMDGLDDWNLSPERDSELEKPVFEDSSEFENYSNIQPDNGSWDKVTGSSNGFNTSGDGLDPWEQPSATNDAIGWNASSNNHTDIGGKKSWSSNGDANDAWQTSAAKSADIKGDSWSRKETNDTETWEVPSSQAQEVQERPEKSNAAASWGSKGKDAESNRWNHGGSEDSRSGGENKWSNWQNATTETQTCTPAQTVPVSGWSSQTVEDGIDPWKSSANKSTEAKSSTWSGWGREKPEKLSSSSMADGQEKQEQPKKWSAPGSSESKGNDAEPDCWSQGREADVHAGGENAWSHWNQGTTDMQTVASTKLPQVSDRNSGEDTADAWTTSANKSTEEKEATWSSWSTDKTAAPSSGHAPDSQETAGMSENWKSSTEWEADKGNPKDDASTNEWDKPVRGWGGGAPTEDWKMKKKFPARAPRTPGVDSGGMMYTVTRQRLDLFMSEEQDILSDVEPMMRSIRRILHNSGYNDGDPLSADDQSFILESIFNYHPDKVAKSGSGIEHVTMSKHSVFQESKCFYIVSTDGEKQDFSYRKCLEGFVKNKYPDLAEEFNGKYFTKPRPRAQNTVPDSPGFGARQSTPVPLTPAREMTSDGAGAGAGAAADWNSSWTSSAGDGTGASADQSNPWTSAGDGKGVAAADWKSSSSGCDFS